MNAFGHRTPIRGANGEVTGLRDKPAVRITRNTLSGMHGPDRDRKLVVRLIDGDLIEFRPAGTQRRKVMSAFDLYDHIMRTEANAMCRAKRESQKERKAIRLAQQRQARAEARLTRP